MDSTHFLARLLGLSFAIISAAMLFEKKKTILALESFLGEDGVLYVLELACMAIGLAILLNHSTFMGGTLSLAVTVIGWIFLIRGVVGLFLSGSALRKLYRASHFEENYYPIGIFMLVLGACLTYAGFLA